MPDRRVESWTEAAKQLERYGYSLSDWDQKQVSLSMFNNVALSILSHGSKTRVRSRTTPKPKTQYVVKVPWGFIPGDTVKVTHEGRNYTVNVPAGKRPGDTFNVSPPTAGGTTTRTEEYMSQPNRTTRTTTTTTYTSTSRGGGRASNPTRTTAFETRPPPEAVDAERHTFADWLRRDPSWDEVNSWTEAEKVLKRNGYKLSDWHEMRVSKRTYDRVKVRLSFHPKKAPDSQRVYPRKVAAPTASPFESISHADILGDRSARYNTSSAPPRRALPSKQPDVAKVGAAGKQLFRRASMGPMDRLKQARAMLDNGLITQADYEAVKKKALNI